MKSFTACDSVTHEGVTNTWFTPRNIVENLGAFDLDPCTQSFRPYDTAAHHIEEDLGCCGLSQEWSGRVWLNPPYGREINKWLNKLAAHGNGMALVFSRCETGWGQSALNAADGVNFMRGRISFIKSNGEKSSNAGTGSMLLAFGAENVQFLKEHEGVIFLR